MGRVAGKVAVVSGAARGQGRSHARMLAAEGADIIAVDLCEDIETNEYPLARPEDLEETARLVEKEGQRAFTSIADVRDRKALSAAIDQGVAEFGHLDIVVANAGICPLTARGPADHRHFARHPAHGRSFLANVNTNDPHCRHDLLTRIAQRPGKAVARQ